MLLRKQQAVGQQARLAIECALGSHSCKLRKIIAFREMAKDDIGGLAVVVGLKKSRCSLVGKVTNAR